MKILNCCRHKTALWEGIVYEDDRNRFRVSNGLFDWTLTPERKEKLETVESIDIRKFSSFLSSRPFGKSLLLLLCEQEKRAKE